MENQDAGFSSFNGWGLLCPASGDEYDGCRGRNSVVPMPVSVNVLRSPCLLISVCPPSAVAFCEWLF